MLQKTLFPMAKIAWGGILLFIDIVVKPTKEMAWAVAIAVILDLATGVFKSKMNKVEITSEGYRKTVAKIIQYLIPIVVIWGGARFLPDKAEMLRELAGWLMMFIIYVEVTSIFENLYATDKTSTIARFLYKPALKILKFGIEHNKIAEAADKIEPQKEENES